MIGIGLLIFAADLLLAARRGPDRTTLIRFSVSDLGWVAGSLVLLAGWPELLSPAGRAAVAAVALVVMGFAFWQLLGLRPARA